MFKKKIGPLFAALLLGVASCQSSGPTLRVAATSVPHAEMLESLKDDLKAKGITLEVVVIDDYHLPNRALQEKEVDADFFQHLSFLQKEMSDFQYHLVPLAAVHVEPMGLYSKRIKVLEDLKEKAKIGIPSDPSNQARALALLEHFGLITLKEGASSVLDIAHNPKRLQFLEVDSALLARVLDDVDLAAITTNFALQADILQEAIVKEGKDSPYANLLVIRLGEEDRPDLIALKEALTSEKMRLFIQQQYQGVIEPVF